MQIIIEIDTVDYEYIKNGYIIPIKIDNHIYDAIRKGTPLPKGHGNLIERNKVYKALHCFYAHDALDIVCNLPVIIEADNEE